MWFYDAAYYINPIPQLYSAFGIAAIFYLDVVQVSPGPMTWSQFYQNAERRWPNGKVKHTKGSFAWFKVIRLFLHHTQSEALLAHVDALVSVAAKPANRHHHRRSPYSYPLPFGKDK